MSYRKAAHFIDRGHEHTTIFLPGWALDTRIFDSVYSPYNCLFFNDICSPTFIQDIDDACVKYNIKFAHFIGFSMGAFRCIDIFKHHPKYVASATLIGLNSAYEHADIARIRTALKDNKAGYLTSFYHACCHTKEEFRHVYKTLGKDLCETLDLESLLGGLDYLESCTLSYTDLCDIPNLLLIHGEYDDIAPLHRLTNIYSRFPSVVSPPTGHIGAIISLL
jgi:pimeloyl-ACP methyl ester carboxylesterase